MSSGPSPQAIERLNKILVCLYAKGHPLSEGEIKSFLSDPMTRNDIRSALKRLYGAGMTEFAPISEHGPWRFQLTVHGKRVAQLRVSEGVSY